MRWLSMPLMTICCIFQMVCGFSNGPNNISKHSDDWISKLVYETADKETRKVEKKSIFVQKDYEPYCMEGYVYDKESDRCIRLVTVNEEEHTNYLLYYLNQMYGRNRREDEKYKTGEKITNSPTKGIVTGHRSKQETENSIKRATSTKRPMKKRTKPTIVPKVTSVRSVKNKNMQNTRKSPTRKPGMRLRRRKIQKTTKQTSTTPKHETRNSIKSSSTKQTATTPKYGTTNSIKSSSLPLTQS